MTKMNPRAVALIPARAGSKRVIDKNIQDLSGHPVIAYSITAALKSGVFEEVLVSTDSEHYAEIARHYGADVPFLRPAAIASATSPDIDWVEHALTTLRADGKDFDVFSILRPTSPFRTAETIQRAWSAFLAEEGVDSLRAVEKCGQHPGKMWVVRGSRMTPLLPLGPEKQPWHSSQYPTLPEVYVQNASLEIAWSRVVWEGRTIAGNVLMPFLTQDVEGVDVNEEYDLWYARELVKNRPRLLQQISVPPFSKVT